MILNFKVRGGRGRVEWKDPTGPVNILSQKALAEWESLLPALEAPGLKVLIVAFLKPTAGADLKALKNLKTKEELARFLDRAGGVFQRIKALPAVKIALIHRTCLGGGLEAALLCDLLLTSDAPDLRLGLPEVKSGLIPGLGGTFHLPRRAGLKTGLNMILTGETLPAKKALQAGLVDEAAPADLLERRAEQIAREIIKGKGSLSPQKGGANGLKAYNGGGGLPLLLKDRGKRPGKFYYREAFPLPAKGRSFKEALTESFLGRPFVFLRAERALRERAKGFYPAPRKALQVIKKTRRALCLKEALKAEKRAFLDLALGPESQNLLRLFFLKRDRQKAALSGGGTGIFKQNQYKTLKETSRPVLQVGVLGAGRMGAEIAAGIAGRGHRARVRDVRGEALSRALRETEALWERDLQAGRIGPREWEKRRDNLSLTTEFFGFSQMDLVIEALPEDEDLKKKALREMGAVLSPHQVTATNTSSLRVGALAAACPYPHRFVGMHFFHPVRKMPLVEIVRTDQSEEAALRRACRLAILMGKTPVVVKDSPGFIVNRLLLPYLSEALWLLTEEGHSIRETDRLWREGFGFPVGPFRLMDEVGPDLCLKAAENLKRAGLPVYFPEKASALLKSLGEGRKGGEGFYIYKGGSPKISEKVLPFQKAGRKSDRKISFDEGVKRGLYRLINEAVQIREEGAARAEDIDLAMILGAGFPPFYGGPLKYAEDRGFSLIGEELKRLTEKRGRRFHPHPAFFR